MHALDRFASDQRITEPSDISCILRELCGIDSRIPSVPAARKRSENWSIVSEDSSLIARLLGHDGCAGNIEGQHPPSRRRTSRHVSPRVPLISSGAGSPDGATGNYLSGPWPFFDEVSMSPIPLFNNWRIAFSKAASAPSQSVAAHQRFRWCRTAHS